MAKLVAHPTIHDSEIPLEDRFLDFLTLPDHQENELIGARSLRHSFIRIVHKYALEKEQTTSESP